MKPRMSNTSDTWIFSWQYLLQLPLNRDGLPESLQSSLSRLSLNTSCHSQSQRSFTHKHTTTFLADGDSDRIHRISCDYCNRSRCSCRINRDSEVLGQRLLLGAATISVTWHIRDYSLYMDSGHILASANID